MGEPLNDENESEWDAYLVTVEENEGEAHTGLNEPLIERLCNDFVRYIEEYVLLNLFSMSPMFLWNLYVQLHIHFTACPYMGLGYQPAPNPSPEARPRDDEEEPPLLTREV